MSDTSPSSSPSNTVPSSESLDRGIVADMVNTMKPTFLKDDISLLNPYLSLARSLVMWDHPIHSGIVLSSIVSSLIVARYFSQDIPSIVFNGLYWITLFNLVYVGATKLAATVMGSHNFPNAHHTLAPLVRVQVSEDQARFIASVVVTTVNGVLSYLLSIILVKDLSLSLIGLAGIYVACILTCYLATTTLLLLVTVSAFTLPVAYHHNQEVIDTQLTLIYQLVNKYLGQLLEASRSLRSDLTAKINAMTASNTVKPKEE